MLCAGDIENGRGICFVSSLLLAGFVAGNLMFFHFRGLIGLVLMSNYFATYLQIQMYCICFNYTYSLSVNVNKQTNKQTNKLHENPNFSETAHL